MNRITNLYIKKSSRLGFQSGSNIWQLDMLSHLSRKMILGVLIAQNYNREILNWQERSRTVIHSIRSHFIKRAIIEPTVEEKLLRVKNHGAASKNTYWLNGNYMNTYSIALFVLKLYCSGVKHASRSAERLSSHLEI